MSGTPQQSPGSSSFSPASATPQGQQGVSPSSNSLPSSQQSSSQSTPSLDPQAQGGGATAASGSSSPPSPPYSGNAATGSSSLPPSPPPQYPGNNATGGGTATTQSSVSAQPDFGIGKGMPKYHGIISRALTSARPTKWLEGDSRNPHNPECVAILDPDNTSLFGKRNEKLKKLENLKSEAKDATAFEQNTRCRDFMKFLLNPQTEYRGKWHNKELPVPRSGTGSDVEFESCDLTKLVENKRDDVKTPDGKKISRQQAISLVAEELAANCKPFDKYLENKRKQEEREGIINDLVNDKDTYKEEIREAKKRESLKILNKDGLFKQLNTDHNINLSDENLKEESAVAHILKKLETQKEDIKTQRRASKRKISNYSFLAFASYFIKSKRAKWKSRGANEKNEKLELENKLLKLKEAVAKVSMLESDVDKIEIAANKLLHDLDPDITRRRRQNPS